MTDVEIGFFANSAATGLPQLLESVRAAEAAGFDFVAVQDHPYVGAYLDTFSLMAYLAGQTDRLRLVTNVANLPLRPAPMLAKASASIDIMSGGRFVLGLGGGRAWPQIAALGGPRWSPPEVVAAVNDAIRVCRAIWEPGNDAQFAGTPYPHAGPAAGPVPAHPIPIWLGAAGPRMLATVGRAADGWIAPLSTSFTSKPAAQKSIDAAAAAAGRDPAAIQRVIQIMGSAVKDAPYQTRPTGDGRTPIHATPENWAEIITRFVTEEGFTAVNLVLEQVTPAQIELFGERVLPQVHARLASAGALP